jgi:hypothetical protein
MLTENDSNPRHRDRSGPLITLNRNDERRAQQRPPPAITRRLLARDNPARLEGTSSNGRTFLERFRTKWKPVRVKKTRQNKNLEPRSDSIGTEKALVAVILMPLSRSIKGAIEVRVPWIARADRCQGRDRAIVI